MVRDHWDDVPDEELEETVWERVVGLGEMFPQPVRKAASTSVNLSVSLVQNAVSFSFLQICHSNTTYGKQKISFFSACPIKQR